MSASFPLYLLTGFLGSGKSTLLSRLIRDPGFTDTAVIINEFGEVGLDHALVSKGGEDNTVLLDSGCICCTLTTSLEDTLEGLYYKAERGEIPRFSRVVVETTGLADPGPIATALAGGIFVSRFFNLGAIVTTLDAVHGSGQLTEFDEARLQVALADRVILTKSDIADPEAVTRTLDAARAINPHAEHLTVVSGAVDPSHILASGLMAGRKRAIPACGHGHNSQTSHLDAHGYVNRAVTVPGPASWAGYAAWVDHLRTNFPESLLRAKGLVTFEDNQVYAVQGVRLLFDTPTPIDWGPRADIAEIMVLIARNADADALADSVRLLSGGGQ